MRPTHAFQLTIKAILALGFLALSPLLWAETPSWYQVEVVIFEQMSPNALNEEVWDQFVAPVPSDNTVAFTTLTADQAPGSYSQEYRPADPGNLKLTAIRDTLGRGHQYDVIAHLSWLQPGLSAQETLPVHIQLGEQILIARPPEPPLAEEQWREDAPNPSDQATETTETSASQSGSEAFGFTAHALKDASGFLFVHELEGTITIYRERYLHILTDLVYRVPHPEADSYAETPDEYSYRARLAEATEADSLTPPSTDRTNGDNSEGDSASNTASDTTSNTNSEAGAAPPFRSLATSSETDSTNSSANTAAASASASASPMLTEPAFKPRTRDIPIRHRRRSRSEEIHYLDHPVIGMIVRISNIDAPETTESLPTEETEATPSSPTTNSPASGQN